LLLPGIAEFALCGCCWGVHNGRVMKPNKKTERKTMNSKMRHLVEWMIIKAIDGTLIASREQSLRVRSKWKTEFDLAVEELEWRGCRREALFKSLIVSQEIQIPAIPQSRIARRIAAKLEHLVTEMSSFEDTGVMISTDDLENAVSERIDDGLVSSPVFAVTKYMQKRAAMYRAWADLRDQLTVRRRDFLNRVGPLFPVIYAVVATGRPRTETVAKTLKGIGIPVDDSNLRTYRRDFERDFPAAYREIFESLIRIHEASPRE
jgi:hypothetical protein